MFGALRGLRHLELGGISQAWVLSSLLPPPETLRAHDDSWLRLKGLEQVGCQHLRHLSGSPGVSWEDGQSGQSA